MKDNFSVVELRLLGGKESLEPSKTILSRYANLVAILASDPVNQCLQDGQEHSCAIMQPHEDGLILAIAHVHPGRFRDIAQSLHGTLTSRLKSPMISMGQLVAIIMLDYFVEQPGEASSISLAVSFLPVKADSLPDDCKLVLVHREMISSQEWQQLNDLYT